MKKTEFKPKNEDSKIEINKPSDPKAWQKPGFTLWLYIIFMLVSLYLWQGFQQAKNQEIPYSRISTKTAEGHD